MAAKVATFQERLKELLDSSPKSRATIAREFGVAKQTISAWATGQTSPRTPVANSLAEYFDVSLPWLLGYDVPKLVNKEEMSRYEKYYFDSKEAVARAGFIGVDEIELIEAYRKLSPRGRMLLKDRIEELNLLYGKKPESNTAESV